MHLFYVPEIVAGECILPPEEARHVIKVMRLKTGDLIRLTNGKGGTYKGEIIALDSKNVVIHAVVESMETASQEQLHLAIAPTKQIDRLEWLVEKATEIGVKEISPIICQRSERRNLKTDRLERIAISAMKQSLKSFLPVIHPPIKFKDFLKKNNADIKCIAHCAEGSKVYLPDLLHGRKSVLVMIGPEGDFSEEEIHLAMQSDFRPISLGNYRLRTETAGLAVVCMAAIAKHKEKS